MGSGWVAAGRPVKCEMILIVERENGIVVCTSVKIDVLCDCRDRMRCAVPLPVDIVWKLPRANEKKTIPRFNSIASTTKDRRYPYIDQDVSLHEDSELYRVTVKVFNMQVCKRGNIRPCSVRFQKNIGSRKSTEVLLYGKWNGGWTVN